MDQFLSLDALYSFFFRDAEVEPVNLEVAVQYVFAADAISDDFSCLTEYFL